MKDGSILAKIIADKDVLLRAFEQTAAPSDVCRAVAMIQGSVLKAIACHENNYYIKPEDYEDHYCLRSLVTRLRLSREMYQFQDFKREQLIQVLAQDCVVAENFRCWGEMDNVERMTALSYSLSRHADIYSSHGLDIQPIFPVAYPKDAERSERLMGEFTCDVSSDDFEACLLINVDIDEFQDPIGAYNTAHHEMTHYTHASAGRAAHRGVLHSNHPFYDDTNVLYNLYSEFAFVSPRLYENYHIQPHEHNARYEADHISYALGQRFRPDLAKKIEPMSLDIWHPQFK